VWSDVLLRLLSFPIIGDNARQFTLGGSTQLPKGTEEQICQNDRKNTKRKKKNDRKKREKSDLSKTHFGKM
jgi:hypothetical protein